MRKKLLLLLLSFPASTFAGDWMLSEDSSSLMAGIAWSSADSYWDNHHNLQQDNCTSHDTSLLLRYEYGYSYYHNLFASTSLDFNQCGDDSANGIPDVKIGIRGRMNPYRNHYSWELAAIIPIQGDRFDKNKPGNGAFGIEAGIYRSYVDDPYKKPFTSITTGTWGWGIGVDLWNQNTGHQLWGKISWRHPLGSIWSFNTQLDGRMAMFAADQEINGIFESNKTVDYDVINLSAKFSRGFGRHYRLGLYLNQALWGRNAAKATAIQLELHRTWD